MYCVLHVYNARVGYDVGMMDDVTGVVIVCTGVIRDIGGDYTVTVGVC